MGEVAVSIIIPLYNHANTLERAVRSVLAQTFDDYEIIIVDDGSTDGGLKLAQRIKDDNPGVHIQVTSIDHSGVGPARNAGLSMAGGTWVAFLDSDDEYAPVFLEKLLSLAEREGADWVYCSRQVVFDDAGGRSLQMRTLGDLCYRGDDMRMLEQHVLYEKRHRILFSNCMSLYRRDLISAFDIRFSDVIGYSEDVLFNYEVSKRARCFCYLDEYLYIQHVLPHSATYHLEPRALEQSLAIIGEYERVRRRVSGEASDWYLMRTGITMSLFFTTYLCHEELSLTWRQRHAEYRRFEEAVAKEPVRRLWEQITPKLCARTGIGVYSLMIWGIAKRHYGFVRFLHILKRMKRDYRLLISRKRMATNQA